MVIRPHARSAWLGLPMTCRARLLAESALGLGLDTLVPKPRSAILVA